MVSAHLAEILADPGGSHGTQEVGDVSGFSRIVASGGLCIASAREVTIEDFPPRSLCPYLVLSHRQTAMSAEGQSVPSPLLSPGSALGCFADRRGGAATAVYEYTPALPLSAVLPTALKPPVPVRLEGMRPTWATTGTALDITARCYGIAHSALTVSRHQLWSPLS